ncbi:MAG TPA: hypothetical protein VNT53_05380 [Pseudolysinimonas sp.]|nr:hypothetical protein [Pseudolysinimonas sp.]
MIGFGERPAGALGVECSAAGCSKAAVWRVNWRNPRIHGPERVKVWLACEDHRDHLESYLATRGFPVIVSPRDTPVDVVPEQV